MRWPAASRKVDQDGEGAKAATVPGGRPRTLAAADVAVMKSSALCSQLVRASWKDEGGLFAAEVMH